MLATPQGCHNCIIPNTNNQIEKPVQSWGYFRPKHKDAMIFEYLLSTRRRVPMWQDDSHFQFLHKFVLVKLATSSIRVKVVISPQFSRVVGVILLSEMVKVYTGHCDESPGQGKVTTNEWSSLCAYVAKYTHTHTVVETAWHTYTHP